MKTTFGRATLRGALLAVTLASSVASADGKHVLVLRADGNADAATKTKIDSQVVKLAKNLDGNVEAGEITFSDAAAAVGCSGSEAQCRDDVLGTMGVDEVVSVNVSALSSGDLRVQVHRIAKGAPIKDAQSTIPAGQSSETKLATDVGPIFGIKATKPAGGATPVAGTPPKGGTPSGGTPTGGTPSGGTPTGGTPPKPGAGGVAAGGAAGTTGTGATGAWGSQPSGTSATGTGTGAPVGAWGNQPGAGGAAGGVSGAQGGVAVSGAGAGDPHTAAPTRTAQADPNVTAAPNGQVALNDTRHGNRAVAGLAIGGGLVVLSIILWAEASSTQGDINAAPVKTPSDFRNLQDLESRGDTYSGLGNLFFIGGLVVGGVSGYYFWKDRRAHASTTARLTPALFDHGAGLALTVGGAP